MADRCPSHLQEPQSLLGHRLQPCDLDAGHYGEHHHLMQGYSLVWQDADGVAPVDPTLNFVGGPWHGAIKRGRAISMIRVEGIEGAYWLDTNSGNTPTYHWTGSRKGSPVAPDNAGSGEAS